MKRVIVFSAFVLSMVILLVSCGGSGGGDGSSGGSSTSGQAWSGSDSYGVIAFTLYTDGTFLTRGTITGGGSRSGYGTYSEIGSAITGSFSTSGVCTGPFSATVSGNTMSGSYDDHCGHASNFTASLASVKPHTWQLDGNGFEQFIISESQYYNYNFWYTFNPYEFQMSAVTATIKKQSGSANGGYGIIFCHQDTNNFYRLMISLGGHYSVTARVGGITSAIIPWTAPFSAILNSGYGVENVVSVVQTSPYNFSVLFNGTTEATFTDYNFLGGRAGFYAYVHDQAHEYFPAIPVDIRFKMSSPVLYP